MLHMQSTEWLQVASQRFVHSVPLQGNLDWLMQPSSAVPAILHKQSRHDLEHGVPYVSPAGSLFSQGLELLASGRVHDVDPKL